MRAIATEKSRDARFHRVIDTSTVPFSLLRPVRKDGVVVDFALEYANPASLTTLKLPSDRLGGNIAELFPETWDEPGLFDRYVRVLSTAGGDAPIFVSADPLRLSQVFVNLLTNAAEFPAREAQSGE